MSRFGKWAFACLCVAVVGAGTAQADGLYNDSNHEAPAGLPAIDIDSVAVANDPDAGTVTFRVRLAGAPALTGNAEVLVALSPGSSLGQPAFTIQGDQSGGSVSSGGAVTSSYAGGTLTLTVDESDIGSPSRFAFSVAALPDYAPKQKYAEDVAPDVGFWTYALAKSASTDSVASVSARFTPSHVARSHEIVVHGLTAVLASGARVTVNKVTCTAVLDKHRLAGTGAGGCTFKVPASARDPYLAITTTGKVGTESVTSTDSIPIG